jgi:Fe-S cluster biogenesis protein NfuA
MNSKDMMGEVKRIVDGIKPMLVMQGKDVHIIEATDAKIKLTLSGFCGGCGCSSDYVEGLREMLTEEFPKTEIELEIA